MAVDAAEFDAGRAAAAGGEPLSLLSRSQGSLGHRAEICQK
jgi:hypothetical protein